MHSIYSNYVILIPAYNPEPSLIQLCEELKKIGFSKILVVNDGSQQRCLPIFDDLINKGIIVYHHPINLGKGGALKTGFIAIRNFFNEYDGVITADADGQHLPKDIKNLAISLHSNNSDLILGVRQFHGNIPLRSKFGNNLTKSLLFAFTGMKLKDTQTGLRGIKLTVLTDLLKIKSNGYEFELDMLLIANQKKLRVEQFPIETVYINNNSSSHFNPLIDSLKIYFVLFRFIIISFLTQFIDTLFFAFLLSANCSVVFSTGCARSLALGFNFIMNKKYVFHSKGSVKKEMVQFLALAFFLMYSSYTLMNFLVGWLGIGLIPAKIAADGLLFLFNFSVQRFVLFNRVKEWFKFKTSFYNYGKDTNC